MQTPEYIARHYNYSDPKETRERSRMGVKFFMGDPLPFVGGALIGDPFSGISADFLREEMKVWRPEETIEAAIPFFTQGKVNVVGDPQSGKGTILFGLSEICDAMGCGYVFMDGHHQEAPAEFILEGIKEAEARNIPIFFDSFDYLFIKGKNRTISAKQQQERTPQIVDALTNASVPVAITNHDETWAEFFLDLDLRGNCQEGIDKFPTYEIPLEFMSGKSIRRFLLDHGMSEAQADFLIDFESNPGIITALVNKFGDKAKIEETIEALKNYPVLKELTRTRREDVENFIDGAILGNSEDIDGITQVIRESEHARRFLALTRKLK